MNITYLTPYSCEKNYGKSLNEAIYHATDGWIVLRDSDCMFLTPDYGRQIADVCENTEFDIIGCMTNRLGRPIQLYNGMYDNFNIKDHYRVAIALERTNWGVVEDITKTKWVAGMVMLFRKSLWDKVKFKEHSITWDDQFCEDVRMLGGKLGLMKGLYVFHLYRAWADYPMFANQHLVNK